MPAGLGGGRNSKLGWQGSEGAISTHPERARALRTDPVSAQARKLSALSLYTSEHPRSLWGSSRVGVSPLGAWVFQKPLKPSTLP